MSENVEKIEDEVIEQVETNEAVEAEDNTNPEDNDPMIVEMREAEAEISAAEAKEEGTEEEAEVEKEAETPEPEPKTEDTKAPEEAKADAEEVKMVPKARLDQVLSEKTRLEENLAYTQGIMHTQKEMLEGGKSAKVEEKTGEVDGKTQETTLDANDHDGIIAKAENDILSAAQKYEDGDISLVEFETQKTELNRSIRKQDDIRTQAMVEGAKQVAADVVSQNNVEAARSDNAVSLGEKHPYVAKIDALPEAQANMVWDQIKSEAMYNLSQKGINPADGTRASDTALMNEMASLTDTHGPRHIKGEVSKPAQEEKKTGELSDTAKERSAKLDLSEQQPPKAIGTTEDKRADMTETDVENMDQDQMADMLETAPQIVLKAAGIRNL